MRKYLAVLIAALMLLCLVAGCDLKSTGATDGDGSTKDGAGDESSYDLTAVVAKVGKEEITLGDFVALYDSYIDYFESYGYDITSDEASHNDFKDDMLDILIEDKLLSYEAAELGYSDLTEEQLAEVKTLAEDEVNAMYDYYRSQAEAEAEEDETVDVEARILELVKLEAEYNLGEGATNDDYVNYISDDVKKGYIIDLLKADLLKDVVAKDEDIEAEYAELLASDFETYSNDPSAYKDDSENFIMYGGTPVTYAPEGYGRILHILARFDGELPDEYAANAADMEEAKKEYAELAFAAALTGTDENKVQLESIVAEYKRLEAANEALLNEYQATAKGKIEAAYADLQSGGDFKELMLSTTDDSNFTDYEAFAEGGMLISPLYDSATDWSETVKRYFADLGVGEYSEIFSDDDGYHIIYYLSEEPAGEISLERIRDQITETVLLEIKDTEWTAILDEWKKSGLVTIYKDVYSAVGVKEAE